MIVACPNCGAKNRVDESRVATEQPVCGRCHTKLPETSSADHPIEATDANFQSLLASAGSKPVLVDCWAEWCAPCQMLAPTLDALARESAGRYIIAKLDVDANQHTASQFNIAGIPALLFFKNGRLVDQMIGLQPKPAIAAKLASL